MSSSDFEYDRSDQASKVVPSADDKYFLNLFGLNLYQSEFLILRGTSDRPGLAVQGDERTGLFQRTAGELSVALSGWGERVRFTKSDCLLVARDGTTSPIGSGGGGGSGNLDGGMANSVYGGTTLVDGGGANG